ncbi:hypothetical protein D3C79_735240 [compost metagenome]
MDEHARQQVVLRVGEHGTQGDGAGGLVNRDLGKLQATFLAIGAAVFQGQGDLGGVVADLLQLAAFQFTAQLEQLGRGLGNVDVDRVELLDHCHRFGLAIVDQCTFGNRRASDATAQRGQDLGVTQVDLGAAQRGLSLQTFGVGVVVFLAADSLFADQLLVTVGQRAGRLQVGLGTGQGRLVHRRVDLVQLLAFLDLSAFFELALENDAVNLRTNFGDAVSGSAPRQVGRQGVGLGLQGHDADLRSLRCGRRLFLFTAAEQSCQGDGGYQSGNSWLELHEDPRVARAEDAQE